MEDVLKLKWAYLKAFEPKRQDAEGTETADHSLVIIVDDSHKLPAGKALVFQVTSRPNGASDVLLRDWKAYGLPKPTYVRVNRLYEMSEDALDGERHELSQRDSDAIVSQLASSVDSVDADVEAEKVGKEWLRPFYEFIYDYLDSTMAFVFEDKADAFQDALEYYGFTGDLLADKLEHATDAEVRRFIVDHSIDTSPDNYYGNIKVLDSAIPEGDDPKAHAEAKGLLDDAFGLPIGNKPQNESKNIAEFADRKVVYELPYDSVNPDDAEAMRRHGLIPLGKSGKGRGVERFAVYGKEGDLRGYLSDSVGEMDGDALVDAEDFEADFYDDGDLGNYAKAVLGTDERAAEGHDAEGGECAGPKGFRTESGDDLYGCLQYLIKDEGEAVDGYDEAIKLFNSTSIPAPDREHIVRELQHIKDEELEHIRELKSLCSFVPKGIQGNSEGECEPTGAKDGEATDIEPATGPDAQSAEGGEGDGGH